MKNKAYLNIGTDKQKSVEIPDHTPIPWQSNGQMKIGGDMMARIDGPDGMLIAGVSDRNLVNHSLRDADAAFIVRAVNAHDELIKQLRACTQLMFQNVNYEEDEEFKRVVDASIDAIAKAEGK